MGIGEISKPMKLFHKMIIMIINNFFLSEAAKTQIGVHMGCCNLTQCTAVAEVLKFGPGFNHLVRSISLGKNCVISVWGKLIMVLISL